jgi:hypothetical protein
MRNLTGHTATIDEVVGRILQLWDSENPVHETAPPEEVTSLLGFDLEEAESAVRHANEKGRGNDELLRLESVLQGIRDYLVTGDLIKRDLLGEIEIYRQDKSRTTLIVIIQQDEQDIQDHEEVRLTTQTVYQWVELKYDIEVPEWAPASRTVPELEAAIENAKNFTKLERDKHLITIAGLLDLFADKQGGRYLAKGKPNCSYIAEQANEMLTASGIDLPGVSAETLRDRFSAALNTKKEHRTPQN